MARILLIEDSPTDRAVFTQWLEKAGHEVLATDNAEDGLQMARSQAPQLVLLDVHLGSHHGPDVYAALCQRWGQCAG